MRINYISIFFWNKSAEGPDPIDFQTGFIRKNTESCPVEKKFQICFLDTKNDNNYTSKPSMFHSEKYISHKFVLMYQVAMDLEDLSAA